MSHEVVAASKAFGRSLSQDLRSMILVSVLLCLVSTVGFGRLRGYISTAKKQGRNVLDSLRDRFLDLNRENAYSVMDTFCGLSLICTTLRNHAANLIATAG